MAVTHDYHCSVHGYFESREPTCPMKACKGEVMLVFLQPPAIGSATTKNIDATTKNLALDFGMTDIKSVREGEAQTGYLTRNNKTKPEPTLEESHPRNAAIWGGEQATGFLRRGKMDMKSILAGRAIKPVGPQLGAEPEAVTFRPQSANLTKPQMKSYIADQDNLKIEK